MPALVPFTENLVCVCVVSGQNRGCTVSNEANDFGARSIGGGAEADRLPWLCRLSVPV